MYKVTAFEGKAREKLLEGVSHLAKAVVTTLGPKGRNVAIQRQWGLPIVVHDGVTVSRDVSSSDPLVNVGIKLVREAAQKTNEEAGDGTTTATLLAYELVKGGLKLIDEGVNPMVLRNQIYAVLPQLKEGLKKLSIPVKGKGEVAEVASISSSDTEIGALVAEAIKHVGNDGLVTVEEASGLETSVEYTDGMEFKKGYLSSYFITNPNRMEAMIEDPVIALVNRKLSLINEIVPLLEALAKKSKDMVIIAQDVSGDALATLVHNKMKGGINAVAVAAPPIARDDTAFLEDIAVLTGGKLLTDDHPIDIDTDDTWIGRADKALVTRDTTVIIGGKGKPEDIKGRIEALRELKDKEKSPYQKEKLEERLAKMSTGVGVIKVGAKTELDMREKVERVKDAVGAATAAKEEGIVPGGGTAFLYLRQLLAGDSEGEKLLREVLESPARKLMLNSGEANDTINNYIKQIIASGATDLGYEVNSGKLTSLKEAGIIDPAKVIRLALENAIGVGTSILTTDCIIAMKYEKGDRNVGQE